MNAFIRKEVRGNWNRSHTEKFKADELPHGGGAKRIVGLIASNKRRGVAPRKWAEVAGSRDASVLDLGVDRLSAIWPRVPVEGDLHFVLSWSAPRTQVAGYANNLPGRKNVGRCGKSDMIGLLESRGDRMTEVGLRGFINQALDQS